MLARIDRRLLLVLLAATVVQLLVASGANAANYVVGTTADPSATACPSATATCSLRQLILYIHAHPSPPDTIIVPPGTYTLQLGQLLMNDSVSIFGAGAGSTVLQEPVPANRTTMGDRVLDIEAVSGGTTPTVSISGVEVAGGDANPVNPVDQFFGGDIRNAGTLTLTDDWITNGFACSGGGVANVGGTLTIERSLVSGNHSACTGGDSGGVQNFGTPASGGTPDLPGHLVIDDSTVAHNDARLVGGVFSWNDPSNTVSILNSTIADNTTQDESGGAARGPGAGLGLSAGTAQVQNSIIAGNVEVTGGQSTPSNCAPGPGLTSLGNNIDSGTDCSLSDTIPGHTDQSDTNPLLGPLQNNGGATMTMALLPGSPALNKVPAFGAGCPTTDQRGVPRPQGTACDIGAFELQVPPRCSSVTASTAPGGSTVTVQLSCVGTAPGLTYAIVSNPTHGNISAFNPNTGVLDYTPDPGYAGSDAFTYHATSSGGTAGAATVTITIPPTPSPPTTAPPPTTVPPPHSPGVNITKVKVSSRHHQATFGFKATGVAKGLQCALLRKTTGRHSHFPKPAFRACRSPKTYRHLTRGSYKFEVRALSVRGPGTPRVHMFTIS